MPLNAVPVKLDAILSALSVGELFLIVMRPLLPLVFKASGEPAVIAIEA